jgi:hypothetical protein
MSDKKSKVRLVGLEYLQFGAVRSTGAFPATAASMSTIGNVVPDSAHFVIEDPEITTIYIEEEDAPDIQIFGTQRKYIEFALRDMGTQTLLYAFGGVASAGVYSFPTATVVNNEYAVFAQSRTINGKKLKFQIPRASISASGDLKFAKTDTGTLTFKCEFLTPISSTAISPCVITQV